MSDLGVSLLRLALGLGAVWFVGYGFLAPVLPAREWTRLERAAMSFGGGIVFLTLWMLALDLGGLSFSLPLILGPLLALSSAVLLIKAKMGRSALKTGDRGPETGDLLRTEDRKPKTENPFWPRIFLVLLTLPIVFAIFRATLYPMWAWDEIATWGCKARIFFQGRSLDLTCIDAHNYYPNLVPLLLTYLYLVLGQINDHLVKAVFPLWGAMLLLLLYSLLKRLGLSRPQALGTTAFFALNGTVFIVHLHIAYADLALAYFALGGAGLIYLWLKDQAPRGSLAAAGVMFAGMAWCKFEGLPLAGTVLLAAGLALLWLRPPGLGRRLLKLAIPAAGLALGYLPWKIYLIRHQIEGGSDHIMNWYSGQFYQSLLYLPEGLFNPFFFGILWPATFLALALGGRRLLKTPQLFLGLFLAGNLLAIVLGYALAPTSAEEFPFYVRATLDRLLLHLTPVAALAVGEGLKEVSGFRFQLKENNYREWPERLKDMSRKNIQEAHTTKKVAAE